MNTNMKRKLLKTVQRINSTAGCLALSVVFASAISALLSGGAEQLIGGGFNIGDKRAYQRLSSLSYASVLLGTAAIALTSCVGASLSYLDEEEKDKQEKTVDLLEESAIIQLSDESALVESEEIQQMFVVEKPSRVFSYYIVKIQGCPSIGGLHLFRFSSHKGLGEDLNTVVSARIDNSQIPDLAVIFEVRYPKQENLVGKSFSSDCADPKQALSRYLQFHYKWIQAKRHSRFQASKIDDCKGCCYFHGDNRVVCGIHADGWDGLDCPDKQLIEGLVQRKWEDWKTVEALNEGLVEAEISRHETSIFLKDKYSGRHFSFDFDGNLLPYSDSIPGFINSLLAYVTYFKTRVIEEKDFSSPEKIAELNKGLVNASVRVEGPNIVVIDRDTRKDHFFRHDGFPINPYCSERPLVLCHHDYNLVLLVDYLRTKNSNNISEV
nr:hypothetical protein [Hassalia byssoidea]